VKVTLIYLSLSGNTRKVVEAMAAALREAGHETRTVALAAATPEDARSADLLGVGTPCFANRAPSPVRAFLRTLPPLGGQRAFVFATSSGAPGRVLADLSAGLQARGARVVAGFIARGEDSYPCPYLHGMYPGRPDANDLTAARRFAVDLAEHVSVDPTAPFAGSRADTFAPTEHLYSLVGRVCTDAMLRFLEPKPQLDASRCDQCGWCARACPMDNIALEPYPLLGARCVRCYRCLNGCPKEALDASWRFADPVIRLLYNRAFLRWFGDLRPGERLR